MCDHHRNAVARQCAPAPAGPPAWLSDGILMERPTRSIDAIGVRRGRDVTARVQLLQAAWLSIIDLAIAIPVAISYTVPIPSMGHHGAQHTLIWSSGHP